jgi:hypothetical protein
MHVARLMRNKELGSRNPLNPRHPRLFISLFHDNEGPPKLRIKAISVELKPRIARITRTPEFVEFVQLGGGNA